METFLNFIAVSVAENVKNVKSGKDKEFTSE
jgi:hypothetical protein